MVVKKKSVKKALVKPYALQPGTKAPAFSLQDENGKTVTLSDFKGKKLVVFFYPKDFTSGCTQESCDFRDNLKRVTGSKAAVVGVSADSVDSHRRFREKHDLNYTLLSDPEKKMLNAYQVWQEKSLYGRKFMGIMRTTYLIDGQGVISHVFPKVKVQGHVDEVLAALKG